MIPRLQLALELAQVASDEIARAFAGRNHALTDKTGNDVATNTEKSVEELLARRIAQKIPGDRLLGEEEK